MRLILLTVIFAFFACAQETGELEMGRWGGMLDTGRGEVKLFLDIEKDPPLLSIPEQGLIKVPVADFQFQQDKLNFTLNLNTVIIRFEGTLSEGIINGKYLQNGVTRTFSLTRTGSVPEDKPAHIMTAAGDDREVILSRTSLSLSGRLRTPYSDKGNWAALIIPGSGPTDGDGNSALLSAPNNSLLRLANYLAEQGIPSLRVDKRGTGISVDSAGSEKDHEFNIFIDDAEAWLLKLKELYPERNTLVIGHSQGALVGLAAANRIGCDAFISLSASGFPIDITIERQLGGISSELSVAGDEILSSLRKGRYVRDIPPELNGFFRSSVQPFLISYMQYDPVELIEEANYPVLIVQGGEDSQTNINDAERLMDSALSGEIALIPYMNHLLRDVHDEVENRSTYGEDRLPLSNDLKLAISDFLEM